MKSWPSVLSFAALLLAAQEASASRVLLISIDGLRAVDIARAEDDGIKVPTLERFLYEGASATAVQGVLPTITYPSHTTLVTGVDPAHHGIVSNLVFNEQMSAQRDWCWDASDIRVPTLWDAAHAAGITTANVDWPVTVGAQIDYNLPQIWKSDGSSDRTLVRSVSTPGLFDEMERKLGKYAGGGDETLRADEMRGHVAAELIRTREPEFMTVYFASLDGAQHGFGPHSKQAREALERIDLILAELVRAQEAVSPHGVIAIVSDHGFAPVARDINLAASFVENGLIKVDQAGNVTSWDAEPLYTGGSAAILLHNPNNAVVRERARKLLDNLAANPEYGIDKILSRNEVKKRGGSVDAEFYVMFKPGFEMATSIKAPMSAPSELRGMHGYDASLPEMRSTFLVRGEGVAHRSLGPIDMRDIAPTLAQILGVKLPSAQGHAIGLGVEMDTIARRSNKNGNSNRTGNLNRNAKKRRMIS